MIETVTIILFSEIISWYVSLFLKHFTCTVYDSWKTLKNLLLNNIYWIYNCKKSVSRLSPWPSRNRTPSRTHLGTSEWCCCSVEDQSCMYSSHCSDSCYTDILARIWSRIDSWKFRCHKKLQDWKDNRICRIQFHSNIPSHASVLSEYYGSFHSIHGIIKEFWRVVPNPKYTPTFALYTLY